MLEYASVGLILRSRHNSSGTNIRRDEDGGHSHAKPIEIKRHSSSSCGCLRAVIIATDARWRSDVIVQTSVLVIDNQKRSVLPHWTRTDCVVHHRDELFPCLDVVVWMLIRREYLPAARPGMIGVVWL